MVTARSTTAAEELAVERLADGLARTLEPSGADGDVSPGGDGRKETLGFFDGRGEIGVSEHDDFSERVKNAVADAVTLSTIAGILEHADFRVFGGRGVYDCGGLVARAVVNHNNFGVPAALMDAGENRLQGAADAGGLVICGDDDAVLRVGLFGCRRYSRSNLSYAARWEAKQWWPCMASGFGGSRGDGNGRGKRRMCGRGRPARQPLQRGRRRYAGCWTAGGGG